MSRPELFRFPFQAMGGPNEIQLFSDDSGAAERIAEELVREVRDIEAHLSRYQHESIVTRINRSAGSGGQVKVDPETAALIDFAAVCYKQSGGLFDITSGPLRRVWNFRNGRVPDQKALDQILPLIGWKKVNWRNPGITLPLQGMEIDLGGIGKEYAVDRVAGRAEALGVREGLINLGGDLRVLGAQPGGRAWKIGISHPRIKDRVLAVVPMSRGALATSGDYERAVVIEGKRYSHVLNPLTGWPVEGLQSVSVVCDSCLVAGASATIAMLSGERRGVEFLRELGLPFLAVLQSGEITKSELEITSL